jgi:hypothetical protein
VAASTSPAFRWRRASAVDRIARRARGDCADASDAYPFSFAYQSSRRDHRPQRRHIVSCQRFSQPGQTPRVSNVFHTLLQPGSQHQRSDFAGSHEHLGQRIRPPSRTVTAGAFFVMTRPKIIWTLNSRVNRAPPTCRAGSTCEVVDERRRVAADVSWKKKGTATLIAVPPGLRARGVTVAATSYATSTIRRPRGYSIASVLIL